MTVNTKTHKLLAIMFTDIVGYTAMMADNEALALAQLATQRKFLFSFIAEFDGDLIKEMGDGTLSVFSSASQAARCAKMVQKQAKKQGVNLRIGLHVGEVVIDGSDVFGDGVNLASRIESIARAGGISMSDVFCQAIKNKSEFSVHSEGKKKLKGISEPIIIYALMLEHTQHFQKDIKTDSSKHITRILLVSIFAVSVLVIIAFTLITPNIVSNELRTNENNDPNNSNNQSVKQVQEYSPQILSEQEAPLALNIGKDESTLIETVTEKATRVSTKIIHTCNVVKLKQFSMTASSSNGRAYNIERAIDGKINTGWWAKVGETKTSWIKLSFTEQVIIKKIEILNGYPDLWRDNARLKTIKLIYDDQEFELHSLKDNIPRLQPIDLKIQSVTRHLSILIVDLYQGLSYNAPGINEINIYGCGIK